MAAYELYSAGFSKLQVNELIVLHRSASDVFSIGAVSTG